MGFRIMILDLFFNKTSSKCLFRVYIIPSKILAKVKLYFTLAINQVMVKLVKKRYKVKKKRLFKTSL